MTPIQRAARQHATTLVATLRERSATQGQEALYTFLRDGERAEERLTYDQLDARARAVAARLQARDLVGERVLLLFPPGLDFVAAFFGCLYAGAVAVPCYPPGRRGRKAFASIVHDAGPRAVLVSPELGRRVEILRREYDALGAIEWLTADGSDDPAAWDDSVTPEPDGVAFLQYTSGSTSEPKGVMVSHANLVHNQETIRRAFGTDERSVIVTWLPLYHDMGLIGGLLQPLFVGASCVLMSPVAFLQRPRRWLEAVSRYRGTVSGGPDFAYDLCVRRVAPEQRAGLDLSSWRVAFNGSEPVRPETLDRFAAAFEGAGFDRRSFYPCYGLAEATLFVAGGDRTAPPEVVRAEAQDGEAGSGAPPPRARVACGRAWNGQRIEIVEPESRRRCSEGEVGEVWVAGPSVALGYWRREEQTRETFRARIAGSDEDGTEYLRTGDLGFLRGGRLFVTGRLKDLIIIRGQNHYPQDVEATVESVHPDLRRGCSAAFSVEADGGERLVVVQELKPGAEAPGDELAARVREAVAREHEVALWSLVLASPGSVPKTTSGKVRRAAARRMYLGGEMKIVAESVLETAPAEGAAEDSGAAAALDLEALRSLPEEARASALEAHLAAELGRVLGVAPATVSRDRAVAASGLDSLGGLELARSVEERFGVRLELGELLSGLTLQGLAALVADQAGRTEPEAATPAAAGGEMPATRGQEGLWFLQRLDPTSAAYNVPVAAWLERGFDPGAFERAVGRVVERHAALRTTFAETADGRLAQVVDPEPTVDLALVDGSGVPDDDWRGWVAEVAYRPFDLETGPLLRVRVLLREDGRHLMVLALHHIVSDFWSLAVLGRDLAEAYRAETAGEAPAFEPLAATLGEVAAWETERLSGPEGDSLRGYWDDRLAGEPPVLELPWDHPRPAHFDFRGRSSTHRLGRDLSGELRRLGRRSHATLFMTLLAAFDALLYRYSGQEDLWIGAPVHLRERSDLAGVVGYLVNPVTLRIDAGGRPTFAELLGRVREAALGAFAHRHLPFAELARRVQPDPDPSRSPVFQVMFGLHQTPPGFPDGLVDLALGRGGRPADLGGLVLEAAAFEQRTAQFDLEFTAADLGGEIALSLTFASSLFEPSTARRMLDHLARLAASAAAEPGRRLDELDLLTGSERRQLLREWQGEAVRVPPASLPDLLEARADEDGEAVAVRCSDRTLSYGELAERVRRLASPLGRRRLRPEVPVAVLADRSPELLVAFLGILRAGAVYLPLDPRNPDRRLRGLLAESRCRLLLADDAHLERAGALLGEGWDGGPPPSLASVSGLTREGGTGGDAGTAGRLAYVLYTSGSTGRPKGAMVESAGMLNHLHAKVRDLELRPADVVAQNASQAFDISIWQLAAPLLVGGCVDVLPDDTAFAPARLLKAVAERRISVLEVVPSLLAALLDGMDGLPPDRRPGALRWLIPTGEALAPDLCRSWLRHFPEVPVVNAYGPTECSDDVTHHRIVSPPPEGAVRVPIGSALINTELHVLDASGGLVPPGVAGELWVGGAGVGRGYLDAPRRTAEAFLPDPFGRRPGARLYRTGDRVRRLAEGDLEFLGRLDHQVKVRGHRLELGEIELVLTGHPEVREVAVLAVTPPDGAATLVAYAVAAGRGRPAVAEIREFLAATLPDYMLPSAVVYLDELPHTATGKVDRKALPAPEGLARAPSTEYRAPRSQAEEWVAEIWRDLLGVERIGIHDDFFELGGHSLLAAQVASRIRRHSGVELPLRSLFEEPTVARLTRRLEEASGRAVEDLPPLERVSREGELPLLFGEERLWFLDQLHPGSPVYVVPAVLRLEGPLDTRALEGALVEIVRRHEALRTGFAEVAGRPRRVVVDELPIHLPRIDLQGLPGERREVEALRLARAEGRRCFDLARPPLGRFRLLQLGEHSHVAFLTLHHIISDGWSLAVFLRELSTLYRASVDGGPSSLAELDVQLTDYAAWLRRLHRDGAFRRQLAFWRERLGPESPVLDLPQDRPGATADPSRGATLSMPVPPAVAEGLVAAARRHGATPFMAFLAAFHLLLHRYTGQREVVLGTPSAGRHRIETEALIGQLINTLVLPLRLKPGSALGEHLPSVRDVCLDAFANADLPFEVLVEDLRPDRSRAQNPLFQVMFDFQDVTPDVSLPGLELSLLKLSYGVAKFDLMFYVEREGDRYTVFFEYARDLFDATTIDRMARHYVALTQAAVAEPGRPVASLPLHAPAERHHQVLEWNPPALPRELDGRLEELFEARAERHPDAIALVADGCSFSYAGLDSWASRAAGRLRAAGLRPGSLVLLATDRSAALAVGHLAVLKAEGVFVPLDSELPPSRMETIVEEVRPAAALVTDGLRSRLAPLLGGLPVVSLEPPGAAPAEPPADPAVRAARVAGPANLSLAYVIFTSGSTGRPKGVMVSHRAIVSHSRRMACRFGLGRSDRALQFFSPAFDPSLEEIFPTWAAGGTVVLRPPRLFSTFEDLEDFLTRHRVTVVDFAAPYWHEWTRDLLRRRAAVPPSLRLVVSGIEAVSKERLAEWRRLTGPRVGWLNSYGPTESTVAATLFEAGWDAHAGTRTVPIGRPNEDSRAYLLDAGLGLTPLGAPGEIYLGGLVARGYLRRPATTAASFLPDPFSPEPGAVMYRTGDRARRLPDGQLEFIGRVDHQVKVRGHRVELGEIEAALENHPEIRRAVVVAGRPGPEAALTRESLEREIDDPEALAAQLLISLGQDAEALLDDMARLSEDDLRRELAELGELPSLEGVGAEEPTLLTEAVS